MMFAQGADRAGRAATAAEKRTRRLDRAMKTLGGTAAATRTMMAGMFVGLGAAMAARSMVKTIASYELSMATLRGVTRATAEDFELLEDRARMLGATTRFSAKEAAEGLLFLGRAGFSTEQSLAAVGATLNLAQAGAIGLGEAANFASNIVSGFGLAASETNRVVDTMVMTSNSANTNVRQLAEAMKFVAPLSGALGHSIEETAAAIGVLGDAGIQGSMAGAGLRMSMIRLLTPTGQALKAIEDMELSVESLSPATNTLTEIFGRLADAEMTAEQAARIFGARNVTQALALANNVEKMKELTSANMEAAGEAQRMADIMDDTLIGSFKGLISAVQELFLQAGDEGLGGVLRTTIDLFRDAIRMLGGMEQTVDKNRKAAFMLSKVIKWVGIALGALIATKIASFFVSMAIGIGQATIGLITMLPHMVPILATVIAIGAALAALELARWAFDEFEPVRKIIDDFNLDLQKGWFELRFSVRTLITFMKGDIDGFVVWLAKTWKGVLEWVLPGAKLLDDQLGKDVKIAIDTMQKHIDDAVASKGTGRGKLFDFADLFERTTGLTLGIGDSLATNPIIKQVEALIAATEDPALRDQLSKALRDLFNLPLSAIQIGNLAEGPAATDAIFAYSRAIDDIFVSLGGVEDEKIREMINELRTNKSQVMDDIFDALSGSEQRRQLDEQIIAERQDWEELLKKTNQAREAYFADPDRERKTFTDKLGEDAKALGGVLSDLGTKLLETMGFADLTADAIKDVVDPGDGGEPFDTKKIDEFLV